MKKDNVSRILASLLQSRKDLKADNIGSDQGKFDSKVDLIEGAKDSPLMDNESSLEKNNTSPPSKHRKPKSKIDHKRVGPIAIVLSTCLSVLAIVGIGANYYLQNVAEINRLNDNFDMAESVGLLNQQNDQFNSALTETQKTLLDNNTKVEALIELRPIVGKLSGNLKSLKEQLGDVRSLVDANATSLRSTEEKIDDLKGDINRYVTNRKTQKSSQYKRRKLSKKIPSPNLGGAKLVSIDAWGSVPSVVLRDLSGNWMPLSVGDRIYGWQLLAAQKDEAIFQKGSSRIKVVIEE